MKSRFKAKSIISLFLAVLLGFSAMVFGASAGAADIPDLDIANAVSLPYKSYSQSQTKGMTQISSNAHYAALAPHIYFTWHEKQSDNAYLVVRDSFFDSYPSFELIIKCSSKYYGFTVSAPGTYFVPKADGKNINSAYIGNYGQYTEVRLNSGSGGTAGDRKVTGLTPGMYYLVEVGSTNPALMYLTSAGTLSSNPDDLGLLWGNAATGLVNGPLYNFTAHSSYPLVYPGDAELLEKVAAISLNEFNYKGDGRDLAGMSVAFIKEGRVYYLNYGTMESNFDDAILGGANKTPVDENTMYEIASMSKVFTGYLLSYLHNAGVVDMYEPINNYFETKPYVTIDGDELHPTLVQLSSHFSGFPRMPGNWDSAGVDKDPDHPYEFYTLDRMEAELRNMNYLYEPGTVYQYSNLGVGVLGSILAKAYYGDEFGEESQGGKGFNALLQELICEPLGLDATTVYTTAAQQADLALPHNLDGTKAFSWKWAALAGAGGIRSSTSDLIRWLAMQLGEYVPDQALYAAFEGVSVPRSNMDNIGRAYIGLNWHLQPNRRVSTATTITVNPGVGYTQDEFDQMFQPFDNAGQRYGTLYWHNGVVNGFGGEYMLCPETNSGVVVLINNRDGGSITDVIAARIMDWVLTSDTDAKENTVKLEPGSEGVPGDRKITGLEPGKYYMVTVTPPGTTLTTTAYVKPDGEITATLGEAGPLIGTEIVTGAASSAHILNGNTYMVVKSDTPFPDTRNIRELIGVMARQTFERDTLVSGTSPPQYYDFVGMATSYMKKDGTIEYVSFGQTERPDGAQVDENTVFGIVGLSQQFKVALIQYMVEGGYISMDDTLDMHINIAPYTDGTDVVYPTLQQLREYKAGLKYPAQSMFIGYSHDQLLAALETIEYNAVPGTATAASAYYELGVLGAVLVEAYNAHPDTLDPVADIHELLDVIIFEPLGMTSTAIDAEYRLQNPVMAMPHSIDGIRQSAVWTPGIYGLNNGIDSTSADMARWFATCMRAFNAEDESQLSTLEIAIRKTMVNDTNYGWRRNASNGLFFYLTRVSGFTTQFIFNPATKTFSFTVVNNQDPSAVLETLNFNIVQSILSK